MLIGKLTKNCVIRIYKDPEADSLQESFTLVKLSDDALLILLKAISRELKESNQTAFVVDTDGSYCINCIPEGKIHKAWKAIAVNRKKESPESFVDVTTIYKTTVAGTSVLIRDPENKVIKIAKRNGDDRNSINRVCIDNDIRERFFSDAKCCELYRVYHKYGVSSADYSAYKYWSDFMNHAYLKGLKDAAKAKK